MKGFNMRLLHIGWLVVLLAAGLCGPVWAQEQKASKTFVIGGTGTIRQDDPAPARQAAIQTALVSAVKRAARELLPAGVLARSAERLDKLFYRQPENYVETYRVLTELAEEQRYEVLVQVTVSLERMRARLKSAGLVPTARKLPRLLFFISEQGPEDPVPRYWWGKPESAMYSEAGRTALEHARGRGFPVVDPRAPELDINPQTLSDTADLSVEEAVAAGRRWMADVVIVGGAFAQANFTMQQSEKLTFRATMTARAFWTDTGEEVAATTRTAIKTGDDTPLHSRQALEEAGRLAAATLTDRIAQAWERKRESRFKLNLVVGGTENLKHLEQLRQALGSIAGENSYQVREMRPNETTLLVDYQGKSVELARALRSKSFDGFDLRIYEVTDNVIRMEITGGR
jgi:hypothetical protein